MDEMIIRSKLAKMLIAKAARKMVKKKLGYDVKFDFDNIHLTMLDGTVHLRLEADAELDKAEFMKLLKETGLGEGA